MQNIGRKRFPHHARAIPLGDGIVFTYFYFSFSKRMGYFAALIIINEI